jgi:flagellar basal body rod protein FlgG
MSSVAAAQLGIHNAMVRFDRATERVARMASQKDEVDPVEAIADQIEAETEFEANVHSLRAQDEMMGQLLDIVA